MLWWPAEGVTSADSVKSEYEHLCALPVVKQLQTAHFQALQADGNWSTLATHQALSWDGTKLCPDMIDF